MVSLYTFSQETLSALRKFRFGSARATSMEAIIYIIDKESYEIKAEDNQIIDSIESLIEELPDNSPRYILLSYPMKLPDGRLKSPFVLLYWIPPTSGQESRMLYAGAVEEFREKAGVSKLIKLEDEEEIENIEEEL
ncbi:uncharacterized protein RJT21DRAFT_27105 [Scheffersomyces amazonensis]|uniref:uncharacterized protein n=1 Tax=Scheffersomyces amazonensis TaxID=1078765 RepID=UPI00315D6FE8